jgi:hypothetical protein
MPEQSNQILRELAVSFEWLRLAAQRCVPVQPVVEIFGHSTSIALARNPPLASWRLPSTAPNVFDASNFMAKAGLANCRPSAL